MRAPEMTQYRFTKRDGTFRYEFLDAGSPYAIPRLRQLMQLHSAVKAEPVEAPTCPLCTGPVCPIIDMECGQCDGTGTTDAMGYEEECPVCDGTGRLAE